MKWMLHLWSLTWAYVWRYFRSVRRQWLDYPHQLPLIIAEGKYKLVACAGTGSYGQVYEAIRQRDNQRVAIKRANRSKGKIAIHLLEREYNWLQGSNHSLVPKAMDWIHNNNGERYFVQSWMEGINLEDLVAEHVHLTERQLVAILLSVCEPLKHLHHQQLVHRDVRLPNILVEWDELTNTYRASALLDLGLACKVDESLPDELEAALPVPQSSEGSWAEVRQQLRIPQVSSDLIGLGHCALFMLYAQQEEGDHGDVLQQSHPALATWIERTMTRQFMTVEQAELELQEVYAQLCAIKDD